MNMSSEKIRVSDEFITGSLFRCLVSLRRIVENISGVCCTAWFNKLRDSYQSAVRCWVIVCHVVELTES